MPHKGPVFHRHCDLVSLETLNFGLSLQRRSCSDIPEPLEQLHVPIPSKAGYGWWDTGPGCVGLVVALKGARMALPGHSFC